MKANVGGIDRIVRITAGLVLIGLAATGTVGLWGWLGVVPLATGAIGWCPPYAIFGFNTCARRRARVSVPWAKWPRPCCSL